MWRTLRTRGVVHDNQCATPDEARQSPSSRRPTKVSSPPPLGDSWAAASAAIDAAGDDDDAPRGYSNSFPNAQSQIQYAKDVPLEHVRSLEPSVPHYVNDVPREHIAADAPSQRPRNYTQLAPESSRRPRKYTQIAPEPSASERRRAATAAQPGGSTI